MAAPLTRRLAQHLRDQREIGLLALLRRFEGLQALEHLLAGFQVLPSRSGLQREELLARLERCLECLLEPLSLGRRVAGDSLVDRSPFLLQRPDVLSERLGFFVRAHQRFHFLDQLDALRGDGIVLPLLELVQPLVELLQAPREVGWHRGRRLHCLVNSHAKPGRLARVASPKCVARQADQAADFALGLRFRGPLLGSGVFFGFASCGHLGQRVCLGLGALCSRLPFDLEFALSSFASLLLRLALGGACGGSLGNVSFMCRDDFPAALQRLLATLLDLRFRSRGKRAPSRRQCLQRRRVNGVMRSRAVPLERCAQVGDLASVFFRLALLRRPAHRISA